MGIDVYLEYDGMPERPETYDYDSPEMKEYMASDGAECVVQRIGCRISQLRRRCSPPSPTPILISEEPEHPAGIGHRLKSQEVLDEGIDLSRDR